MQKKTLPLLMGLALASGSVFAGNLMDIYKLAQKNDPQLLKAAADKDRAQYSADGAFANYLPNIEGNANYTKGYASGAGISQRKDYDITLSQKVIDFAAWQSVKEAELQATQGELGYQLASQSLIVRVAQAYFDVLKAQDNLQLVVAEKKAIDRQLQQTKERFAVGLSAITDVHEAQAKFDQSVANEISKENDLETARESLREITNAYHKEIDGLNITKFSSDLPTPATSEAWVEKAKQTSIQIANAKVSVEIAKNNIDKSSSGHLPTLSLSARHAQADNDPRIESAFNPDKGYEENNSITLSLKVPIYSGGATSAGVDAARAGFVSASESMEQTYREVMKSTRTSFNNVRASVSTIKALEQSVISAQSALTATEAGFEVGTRTIVDVLQQTTGLYQAKQQLSEARYNYILAILSLKAAAGNLTEADLAAVNKSLG
ncbi:outer membrane channel protein TolC [Algicola sagamiensis]|uniref:outer membrane channel protein TolC n=1 Tax=Algicola sagamiensis TaxID=163869 RepID=UPI0003819118|nr:outer membrane channel protein TolC [Algicola sagamiensis]